METAGGSADSGRPRGSQHLAGELVVQQRPKAISAAIDRQPVVDIEDTRDVARSLMML